MTPLLKPIAASLGTTDFVLRLCLAELNEEDARQRVRHNQGPSIAWQIGHLLDHRTKMLALLGAPKENLYTERFTDKGATEGSDYPSLAEFQRQWDATTAELRAAMETATEETLAQVVEKGPHGEKTALDQLVFLCWHDAYHVGGVGLIQREMGYRGPAELAMAAMAA
ncbi:MAG: DinB family protein [Acidobacteria bacterium]|nr:DinB family protein [Acidobacteriota bacterium]